MKSSKTILENKIRIVIILLIISLTVNFFAIESLQKGVANFASILSYLSNDFSAILGIFGSILAVYVGYKLSNNQSDEDIEPLLSMLEHICDWIEAYERNGYIDGIRAKIKANDYNYNTGGICSLVYINDWYKYTKYIKNTKDREVINTYIADIRRGIIGSINDISKEYNLNKIKEVRAIVNKYKTL